MTRTSRLTRPLTIARLRVRGHLRAIAQTAIAALGAWWVAGLLGTESHPTFASIAAVISLGATFDERPRKAVQLIGGVVLGILVADLLINTIGTGLPQIGLLVLLAMLVAVMVGGSEMLISESAVSAVLIASLPASTAGIRLTEGLVGGAVALLVHAFVFPPDPLLGVARAANVVFGELGIALRDAGAALAERDPLRADAAARGARQAEIALRHVAEAVAVGQETARWSPVRRRARGELARFARTVEQLDPAIGEIQTLTRDVMRLVRSGRPAPEELRDAIQDLGRAVWEVPGQFDEPWRSGDVHVLALGAGARATAAAENHPDRLVRSIAGRVRSVAVDITRVSEAAEDAGGVLADAATEELLVNAAPGRSAPPPPQPPASTAS